MIGAPRIRAALVAGWLTVGCGPAGGPARDEPGERTRGEARVGGEVVSTVDGHPITADEIARAAQEAGVTPREALRALQDEAILAQAAERAGAADHEEVWRATRRARVQALLARTVEAEVTAQQIDEAQIEAAFERDLERFERPERRRSVHVLARVPDGAPAATARAAEAWIREVFAQVRDAPDAEAAVLALQRRPGGQEPFPILVEDVPALGRADGSDPAYLEALFARSSPGLLDEPVRSSFGWHVVVLTEIEPAWEASREEALQTLRDERLAQLRADHLEAMIRRLASERGVEVEADAIRAFLDDPRFLGPEP